MWEKYMDNRKPEQEAEAEKTKGLRARVEQQELEIKELKNMLQTLLETLDALIDDPEEEEEDWPTEADIENMVDDLTSVPLGTESSNPGKYIMTITTLFLHLEYTPPPQDCNCLSTCRYTYR